MALVRLFALALLATFCSCAMHSSFPVTSYSGTVTTSFTDCATGAATLTDTVEMLDLVLEDRDASAGFSALEVGDERCTFNVRPDTAGATSFTLYPGSLCERSQPDGSRIRFAFTSGTMQRSASAIMGAYVVRVTSPPDAIDGCVVRHVTFTATER